MGHGAPSAELPVSSTELSNVLLLVGRACTGSKQCLLPLLSCTFKGMEKRDDSGITEVSSMDLIQWVLGLERLKSANPVF